MSLKTQPTCIAALALLLPWFALSYLQYLDLQFRNGQNALLEHDRQRLQDLYFSDPIFQNGLKQRSALPFSIAAVPLDRGAQVDGFVREWPQEGAREFVGLGASASVSFQAAESVSGDFWLLLTIKGLPFGWHVPQSAGFDELKLDVGAATSWRLRAAAEGGASIEVLDSDGRWRPSFTSEAVVRSRQASTVIEWQLPRALMSAPMQLSYYSHALGYSVFARASNAPFYAVSVTRQLEFSEYLPGAMRVRWFDANGWLYASKGEFDAVTELPDIADKGSWLRRLYLLWFREAYPPLPTSSVRRAKTEPCLSSEWFSYQLAAVNRQCVDYKGLGTLVVDYRDEARFAAQATGLGYFLALSLLFVAVLLLAFLGFGSLHSWRIRRLAKLITALKRGGGNADKLHKSSGFNDEIDQLRGQFADFYRFAEEQKAYLSALAPKLSHELKTPLAIISSSLDNLAESNLPSSEVYVERAKSGVQRLSHILHAMTSAQTFEQTLGSSDRENLPLQPFFVSVSDAYGQIYNPQPIVLKCSLEDECWRFSPDLFAQMLDKLVANACDFSAEGAPVEITVQLTKLTAKRGFWSLRAPSNYRRLVISVINTGQPIPSTLAGSLFDALVTSRSSRSDEQVVHLGLGLYIARLICEWHGGTIAAFSEPLDEHLAKTYFTMTFDEQPLAS